MVSLTLDEIQNSLPAPIRALLRVQQAQSPCWSKKFGDLDTSVEFPLSAGPIYPEVAFESGARHFPPRSLRSFAQYSRRFLISRSKPRSGGS